MKAGGLNFVGAASQKKTTPNDSAHDITQYRLERRDIVGITSLSLLNPYPRQSASRWPDARLRRRARIFRPHPYLATSAPRASDPSKPPSA
jgi:hypothetical protein